MANADRRHRELIYEHVTVDVQLTARETRLHRYRIEFRDASSPEVNIHRDKLRTESPITATAVV